MELYCLEKMNFKGTMEKIGPRFSSDTLSDTVVISQPRYLPATTYFYRMIVADLFIYLDSVQYTPRDWENRNRIKTSNGAVWLSVPVIHTHRSQLISETAIDYSQNWRGKHLTSIQRAYAKAPHFDEIFPRLEEVYEKEYALLMDLDCRLVELFCELLKINCTFTKASDLPVSGSGQELLLDICRQVGAKNYLSGPFGREYLQESTWEQEGINLNFLDYVSPTYPQLHGPFVPDLSIIDMLMNCGHEKTMSLIKINNFTRESLTS